MDKKTNEIITLGAGCFWCIEAIFNRIEGVSNVEPGYMGGHVPNPTYEDICTGASGHAEVARIKFNNTAVSLAEILEIFWKTHDPTTLNKQGNDIGTQYRSAIFYENEKQKKQSIEIKESLDQSNVFEKPIVTEISPAETFYPAENYHHQYYERNKSQPYCQFIIKPKIERLEKFFESYIRP